MINNLLIILLEAFRPLLGPAACRFHITCGNYAVEQLKTQSLVRALYNITKRLLSCNSFYTA